MCEESDGKIHSGCTAVTAFLRVEDADGQQSFLSASPTNGSSGSGHSLESEGIQVSTPQANSSSESIGAPGHSDEIKEVTKLKKDSRKRLSGSRIRKALRSLGGGSGSSKTSAPSTPRSLSPGQSRKSTADGITISIPPSTARRVLYSANAGDARGVLSRDAKAVRLTYDHKGSDKQEAKRIIDAGGFVMSGRVNGVLAVTRSLGDSSMKEFVVGAPYTTETELCEEDEFLILACDGASSLISIFLF